MNVASNLIISEPNLYSFVKVIEGVHSIAHGKIACIVVDLKVFDPKGFYSQRV